MNAGAAIKEVTVSAKVIRADGAIEDLGVIASSVTPKSWVEKIKDKIGVIKNG